MLKEDDRDHKTKDQRAPKVSRHHAVDDREDHRCGQGNKTDIVHGNGKDRLACKHDEEHAPIEGENGPPKAGKALTSAKLHIERKDVSDDRRDSRHRKDEGRSPEKKLCQMDGGGCLGDIKERAGDAKRLAEQDQGV